jgi:S-adenosylmethionine:tRNA ribosyltransferase-isomerase
MSTSLSDYDYHLPDELIASRPLQQRDQSRMMVLHRDTQTIEHRQFRELTAFVEPGDLFVLNDTRVLAARKFSDDGAIEFLFLEKLGTSRWKCWVKPGRKMRVGATTKIDNMVARVEEITEDGERILCLERDIDVYSAGSMPLPPYIRRLSDTEDEARYQTVFARESGAIAAPTAGLHFTPEILGAIPHTFITLHVGPGTFKPVHAENITEHVMHEERFAISEEAADKINKAQRVIAVGTTSVRVLESVAPSDRLLKAVDNQSELETCSVKPSKFHQRREIIAQSGATNIFIYPPFQFRAVDGLLTNFHLPRSTLLMLVSAFAGRGFILDAYAEAIRERYRFYSYGDCMLIL